MPPPRASEFVITGVAAERPCGVMAACGGDHRMQYSPFVNFAKDNELKLRDGRTEERTRLAELQRVGDTA